MPADKKTTEDKKTTTKKDEPEVEKKDSGVEATVPPEKKEKVTVDKDDLKTFMKRLETLETDNKRLMAAADKGRLAHVDAKLAGDQPLIRTVRLSRLTPDGPLVVAWKLEKNISYVDGNKLVEDQVIRVFFEDGTEEQMKLLNFYRGMDKKTVAEIVSRKTDEKSGEEVVEVEMKDGKRLEIPLKFVN